jgi:hypothetical protein
MAAPPRAAGGTPAAAAQLLLTAGPLHKFPAFQLTLSVHISVIRVDTAAKCDLSRDKTAQVKLKMDIVSIPA